MKVLFSTWKDKVIDNRGKPQDAWTDCPVKLPAAFDANRKLTAFMGWGGIVVTEGQFDMVELAANYTRALQKSSCGKCFPCRVGTRVMQDIFGKIMDGKGTPADIKQLEELCDSISKNSKCGIGQLGPEPVVQAVQYFKDDFIAYSEGRKKASGLSYPYKMTAPCTSACPTGMDIPLYIEGIKEGNHAGSLATIRQASPMASTLGRACFHPCENNCRRDNVDKSLSICKLKRFAWDYEDQHVVDKPGNPLKHTRPEKVAVIGAGPSGLSCAYYLILQGFHVTVFEKLPTVGGAAWTGIPHYRIPKHIMTREVQYLKDLGVEIKFNVNFGKDATFASLRGKGYKAFFLATGGDISKEMGVEGEKDNIPGVYGGIGILKDITDNVTKDVVPVPGLKPNAVPMPKTVLVVGAGNTAMDCVRSYIRLGCEDVNIVYRRTKKEMPADPHEVHESEDEGVKYNFLLAPTKLVTENGKLAGLECQKMELGPPDESGRRKPMAVKGSEHVIKADMIISAIGQDCDIAYLKEEPTVQTTKWKTIVTNEETFQTAVPDVFAGGDVVSGPLNLVTAVGHARRAGQSIGQFLRGEQVGPSDEQRMEKVIAGIGAYDKDEAVPQAKGWERKAMPICSRHDKVGSFNEVELGYPMEDAMEEAARCMRCYIVGMACVAPGGAQ
ncbi:MAG: FAD-dependent oxidoreductase [Nitrospinae bacterium]|nr:FAD-dependent oxidoreductase [Nitrospinota bacterium]